MKLTIIKPHLRNTLSNRDTRCTCVYSNSVLVKPMHSKTYLELPFTGQQPYLYDNVGMQSDAPVHSKFLVEYNCLALIKASHSKYLWCPKC